MKTFKPLFWGFLLLLLPVQMLLALPVSPDRAETLARQWMKLQIEQRDASGEKELLIRDWYLHERDGYALYYVFNFEPLGFVIVAADDASVPVLGYSLKGTADPADIPLAATQYFIGYEEQLIEIIEKKLPNKASIDQWETIIEGKLVFPEKSERVDPLISSKWNQNSPWNKMCPKDPTGPGGHVYAGCVAVAMSQLMHFWKHPAQGSDYYMYYHSSYGLQSANFGNTTYDWENMPNNQGNTNVQELLYHAGVSLNMSYGPSGSTASSARIRTSLVEFFKYDRNTVHLARSDYSSEEWKSILIEQLDKGWPMHYSGAPESGTGHAFVCDGYENATYFHFNWGWGGSHDGFFHIDHLNPGSANYSNSQRATINIIPASIFLSGITGDQQISLHWEFNEQSGTPETFRIFRNGSLLATTSDTVFVDATVTNMQSYNYSVSVVYDDGRSSLSNAVSITPHTGFAGGSGAPDDPFLLASPEHLDNIRYRKESFYRQIQDIDLGQAPWNEGEGWQPLGMANHIFRGAYHGGGHAIKNLTINRPETSYVGLFGSLSSAVVEDVHLVDVMVAGGENTGALVGAIGGAVARNVSSSGIVTGSITVGGVAGRLGAGGLITQSYSRCQVEGESFVGGLLGRLERGGEMSDVFARGEVTGETYVGGLTGTHVQGDVIRAYSTGVVTGESFTGGLMGSYSSGSVTACYWDMESSGQATSPRGEGRSKDQMTYAYDSNTFVNWDFSSIWFADTTHQHNQGYPCLHQKQTVALRFMVTEPDGRAIQNATITLNGKVHDAGKYVFEALLPGTYNYVVTRTGYTTASGTVILSDKDVELTEILSVMSYDIIVSVSPEEGGDVLGSR
jgi:hypothetical protein